VRSAVGSGDCLTAGLAVAHDRGHDWRQALRLGVACGAANCLRPELGMIHRADVERLLPTVASADA
jgi:tagatose 6-phosphate kinase